MELTLSEAIDFLRRVRETGGLVEVDILETCIRESLIHNDGEILVTIKI